MAFHDVQFSTAISYGSRGGPGFKTDVTYLDSGATERLARWPQARHKYNVSYGVKKFEDLAAIKTFYIARQGGAFSFRYKDWFDCNSTTGGGDVAITGQTIDDEDQSIGTGNSSNKVFQLVKKYTSGPTTRTRTITKPVSGTVLIALDGVNQASGWSVNLLTGVITFTTAPGGGVVVTAGYEFDVPVTFAESADEALATSIDDFNSGTLGAIELEEEFSGTDYSDEFYFGGSYKVTLTSNLSLTESLGRVLILDPGGASRDLTLPTVDFVKSPAGGPWFVIVNDAGAAENLVVKDHLGTTVVTIAQNEQKEFYLHIDYDASTFQWVAL